MQITLSKKTAKTLNTAIWLLIQTCNKKRGDKEYEANEEIMKTLGVTIEDLNSVHNTLLKIEDNLDRMKKARLARLKRKRKPTTAREKATC